MVSGETLVPASPNTSAKMAKITVVVDSTTQISNSESKDLGCYKHKLLLSRKVTADGVTTTKRETYTLITEDSEIGELTEGVRYWSFDSTKWKPEPRTFTDDATGETITYKRLVPRD
jgi:hypothetical protein